VIEGLEAGVPYSADITSDFGGPAKEYSGSFTVPAEVNADDVRYCSLCETMNVYCLLSKRKLY
jgi:hypothetical protein